MNPTQRLVWYEAHPSFESGLGWYPAAVDAISRIAGCFHRDARQVAAIVAVMSPKVGVQHNVRLALDVLRGGNVAGLGLNVRKALTIAESTYPAEWEARATGPKVSAFRRALLGEDCLVLDSWAIFAAIQKDAAQGKAREMVSRLYRARAQALQLPVSAYQAGIWAAVRAHNGYKPACMLQATKELLP